jgi:hypothetical protein
MTSGKDMKRNYFTNLNLREGNVLATPEDLSNIPEGVEAWFSLPHAAQLLNKSIPATYYAVSRGDIKSSKFSRTNGHQGLTLVSRSAIQEYKERLASWGGERPVLEKILEKYLPKHEVISVIGSVDRRAKKRGFYDESA